MIIHCYRGEVPAGPAAALAALEERFSYPLGPGRTFRISHGDDYARFFRAQGDATVFVAERDGRALGCLAVARRDLVLPGGQQRPVAYLADLKIAPEARGGFVLWRLMTAAEDLVYDIGAAFGVVMEGTAVTPADYTGRLGIPAFAALGRVAVLRLPAAPLPHPPVWHEGGDALFRRLSRGRYAAVGGLPHLRSEMSSSWLVSPAGDACGLLEDTRRAKRLYADDGAELLSAHLSHFAAATPGAGARLLRAARAEAHRRGLPALFVAVPEADAPALCETLQLPDLVTAPAIVYGAALAAGEWNLNTAEI